MSDTPKLMASALRILAGDIQAPDDVPSLCLLNAANMIEQMEKDLAAERAAHLATRRALVWALSDDCGSTIPMFKHRPVIAAARAAVAKEDAKEGQP